LIDSLVTAAPSAEMDEIVLIEVSRVRFSHSTIATDAAFASFTR
jgi:hypothetical protein